MNPFKITQLGKATQASPLHLSKRLDDFVANYVNDDEQILYQINSSELLEENADKPAMIELAGPREFIFFKPENTKVAIVTCGGLCPGLNNVIRSIVMTLWYSYRVKDIIGYQFGYRGLLKEFGFDPIKLTQETVVDIHKKGGTILGSSRGHGERTSEIFETLKQDGVNILFAIGGDGTQRGALAISNLAKEKGYNLSVIGIPKTIDNDLSFIEKSFGFETAVARATPAVESANTEARSAVNGIGLVKVMGRESGFIAAHLALAVNDVNFVLVPEVPFDLDGENGFLHHLEERILNRKHAVIVVSEGVSDSLLKKTGEKDLSGNKKFLNIGPFLITKIKEYFHSKNIEINLKYIDPSYMIRGIAANPGDAIYCSRLGNHAVHAAMSGKTNMIVGLIHNKFVYIPTDLTVSERMRIDPESSLWRDVISITGQPPLMTNE